MADGDILIGVFVGVVLAAIFLRPRPATAATYSNIEEWEIVKDPEGRVVGVKVHRKARREG